VFEGFGHLNFSDLKKLQEKEMVQGMNMSKLDKPLENVCHGCELGKSKRHPFPKKSDHFSSKPLELIHSDVCGPFHISSLGGSWYFASFTDDFSRYVTVSMLKTKDGVIEKFKEFTESAENQHESKVKKFRSDGGGEYISKRFKDICKSRGIVVDGSIPYSPQQNGISERMNRTLVEMARSMIYHANIPQKFWAEAISTAAYLRNRCPTSSFKGETPHERWFGVKPDVDHIRVFGCLVYMHIQDEKRRKHEYDPHLVLHQTIFRVVSPP
jgi:transposase InsO family protein